MTMVVCCATQDYAIQVSDRRFTTPDGQLLGDKNNKAVLFCNLISFAYTGLGHLEGKRTDVWLTEVLSQGLASGAVQALPDAMQLIKCRATRCFKRIGLSASLKRHAFLAVGWSKPSPEEPLSPMGVMVANCRGPQGEWLSEAHDEFRIALSPLFEESEDFRLWVAGEQFLSREVAQLKRSLRHCVGRTTGPGSVIRLLVEAVRGVAARKVSVGEDLLVVCIPKAAAAADSLILASRAKQDTITCEYVAAGQQEGVWYGPNVVFLDGKTITRWKSVTDGQRLIIDCKVRVPSKGSSPLDIVFTQ